MFANTPDVTIPQPIVEVCKESSTTGSPLDCQVALSVMAGTVTAVEQLDVETLGYVQEITIFPFSYISAFSWIPKAPSNGGLTKGTKTGPIVSPTSYVDNVKANKEFASFGQ